MGEYYDAAAEFKTAYNKTSPKDKDKRGERAKKLAGCYDRINSTQKAIAAYRNTIRYNKADIETHLSFARVLMKNGSYKEAAKEFQLVLDSLPDNELAKTGLLSAQTAQAENGSRLEIYSKKGWTCSTRAGPTIRPCSSVTNTTNCTSHQRETRPKATKLSGITGTKAGDIFVSQKDDKGKWGKPEAIVSGLNTEF